MQFAELILLGLAQPWTLAQHSTACIVAAGLEVRLWVIVNKTYPRFYIYWSLPTRYGEHNPVWENSLITYL